jgi:hypothetical protein
MEEEKTLVFERKLLSTVHRKSNQKPVSEDASYDEKPILGKKKREVRNYKYREKQTEKNSKSLENLSSSIAKLIQHINNLLRIILHDRLRNISTNKNAHRAEDAKVEDAITEAITEYSTIISVAELVENERHLCLDEEEIKYFSSILLKIVPRKKRVKLDGFGRSSSVKKSENSSDGEVSDENDQVYVE